MKDGAGAWLDTGKTATIAYGRDAVIAGQIAANGAYYPSHPRHKIASSLRSSQ
jgi:hypothetical protein